MGKGSARRTGVDEGPRDPTRLDPERVLMRRLTEDRDVCQRRPVPVSRTEHRLPSPCSTRQSRDRGLGKSCRGDECWSGSG